MSLTFIFKVKPLGLVYFKFDFVVGLLIMNLCKGQTTLFAASNYFVILFVAIVGYLSLIINWAIEKFC